MRIKNLSDMDLIDIRALQHTTFPINRVLNILEFLERNSDTFQEIAIDHWVKTHVTKCFHYSSDKKTVEQIAKLNKQPNRPIKFYGE